MKKTNYWIVALCILSTLTLFAAQDFDALLIELAPLVEANDTAAALKKGTRFFSHILNEQAALKQRVAGRAAKGLPVGKSNIDREAELKKWLADTRALLETFRYAGETGLTLAGSDFQQHENEQKVFKNSVVAAEPEFALWTVGGSSRVDREFFQLPSKVWNTGKLRFALQTETVILSDAADAGARA